MTEYRRLVPVLALAALLTTVFSGPALSQRLTGNMTGRVLDWNGDPVQDAEVTINSPAMITQNVTATSNERGEFRFPGLAPGVYEVRGELSGFGTMLHQNVRVTVGATTELTLELQPQMGELLVVTAEPPTVDTTSTTSGANYTREVLENIPNTRSLRDVFNYTPAVTGSSARGSTVRGNAWRYDAVDVSDPTIGTQLVAFNYDTLDEIQVETGGHPAEVGQATGALVNVVTKSGGNNLSGEANLYFQNDHLTSTNGEEITERFPDLQPATLTKRVDTQFQLGGPIVPNEIWFFGAYRYLDTDREVVGFNDESGNPIPAKFNEQFALFKVTAQLGPNHRIVGGIHWSSFTADHRGADALTPPQSTRELTEAVWVPNLEWTGIFNPTTFGQVRFTVVDNNLDFFPKNDEPSCFNVDTGVEPCSAGIEDLNKRDRRQLTASLSHFRELGGTHDFKFGFEFEDSDSWRDFTANQGLAFQTVGNDVPFLAFTGVQDPPTKEAINRLSFYAQDSWAVSDRFTLNLGVRVDSNEGWFPEQEAASGETQPEMRDIVSQTDVSPRIGIAYAIGGLGKGVIRASFSRYVDALTIQNFARVNGNAISGQVRAVCAGPLGFLCAPGDGEFSSQILSEFGASNTELDAGLRLPKADEFAVGFEIALGSAMAFGVNYVDKNEFDLIEDIETRDFIPRTAHDPGDTEVDEKGNVRSEDPPQTFTVFDPDLDSPSMLFITNPDPAKRDYRGVEFIFNKRMSNRWQLHSSFVVSESTGLVGTDFADSNSVSELFDDPNSLINADGKLTLNRTYQLKFLGTYQAPYGFNISGYYRFLSGRPYNRTARFTMYDSNGDGVNDTPLDGGSILINAETRGSRDLDGLHLLDLRIEKVFELPRGRLGLILDVFEVFNIDTVNSKRTRTSAAGNFGEPLSFREPREFRIGVRFIF